MFEASINWIISFTSNYINHFLNLSTYNEKGVIRIYLEADFLQNGKLALV